jgi:UDP-glucose 4-epimerase/UDP-glucuronate decarboxylase
VKIDKRHILITGGAGFIGYHLACYLSDDPMNQIVVVDNFRRGTFDESFQNLIKKANVKYITADLSDQESFKNLGGGYDEVYHLAAIIGVKNVIQRPHEVVRVNALSILYLSDWLVKGGGSKLLFSSTSEVYAWTQQFYSIPIPTSESVPLALTDLSNPRSTYAGSKIFGELAIHHILKQAGVPFTIVRYHNVYGPRMGYEHVIPEIYKRIRQGENPLIVYSSDHSRAFCYIKDALDGTVLAMRNSAAHNLTFHIGNENAEILIGDLARKVITWSKVDVPIESQVAEYDPIERRCPDTSLAREVLDYHPKVSLDDGLDTTLRWYRDWALPIVTDSKEKTVMDFSPAVFII